MVIVMQDRFKPEHAFPLPEHCVLEIAGDDALAFAQSQFMNDLRPLHAGQWQWNGWLDVKGRVQALFALYRESEQRLFALLRMSSDAATPVIAQLRRYVLRSKVSLQLRDDRIAAGSFDDADIGAPNLPMPGTAARSLLLLPEPPPANAALAVRWQRADIESGLPWLPAASIGVWTPQMLSLQRWNAYSVNKGCYPGQEVVARTHYLGQAKRRLVRIASAADLIPGAPIEADGRILGNVVCACRDDRGSVGLAVLGGEATAALNVSGQPLLVRPFSEPSAATT